MKEEELLDCTGRETGVWYRMVVWFIKVEGCFLWNYFEWKFYIKLMFIRFHNFNNTFSELSFCFYSRRKGDFWSDLCFMYYFTCWTLFISRINRAWLFKGLNNSQTTKYWLSSAGRALEWWFRSCGFKPLWGKFFYEMYFVLCNYRSVR